MFFLFNVSANILTNLAERLQKLTKKIKGNYFIFTGNNLENGNVIYFSKKKNGQRILIKPLLSKKMNYKNMKSLLALMKKTVRFLIRIFLKAMLTEK